MKKVKIFSILFSLSLTLILTFSGGKVKAQPPIIAGNQPFKIVQEQSAPPTFDPLIQGVQKVAGLLTLYYQQETGKIYLELTPEQLNKTYLCFISLESGLGQFGVVSGLDLNEFAFQWRRQQNRIQLVVPNLNFRTHPNDPQSRSINRSVSDSVLYSLPILSIHPETQNLFIDLTPLFSSDRDLSGLSNYLSYFFGTAYSLDVEKSYIADVKSFPLNLEVESVFGFSSQNGGAINSASLPDNRSFNLQVHYSILEVPSQASYRPRLADERVGYFTTTYKDISNSTDRSSFVRYINRWNLQKQDPSSPLSTAVKPITFWIENTVPLDYREAIKEGVLLWNKAFEKAGFMNAIQVQQMPDDAPWDPADVRYNTIRWSTSFQPRFNGYGPSHVNPLTGEILDADIVLESNAVTRLKEGVGVLIEASQPSISLADKDSTSQAVTNPCEFGMLSFARTAEVQHRKEHLHEIEHLCFSFESNQQLAMGAIAMSLFDQVPPKSPQVKDYIHQYLRFLTAHEVGHTLGLRHNFHGSTLLSPEELNDTAITRSRGLVSSVMDYVPVNLAPQGEKQGDYFPVVIGPYDHWAIEYGYQPMIASTPGGELQKLQKIAQRAGEEELSFATDEDWGVFLDPAANTYDLSNDMLRYSQWQLDNAIAMWQELEQRSPRVGEGYDQMRRIFDAIFSYYANHALNATLYIGGQSFNRNRVGDPSGRLPFEPIPVQEQREALKTLQKYVFAEDAFQFSPNLLNQLAPSRWSDWGNPDRGDSLEYPIGNRILGLQRAVLREILDPTRLTRLRDLELKTTDLSLTMPEVFEGLQNSIWTEVLQPEGTVEISGVRRSLQREHLNLLGAMILRKIAVPEDAQTLAWYQLKQLNAAIETILDKHRKKMDAYTVAHLEVTRDRILKAIDAQFQSN